MIKRVRGKRVRETFETELHNFQNIPNLDVILASDKWKIGDKVRVTVELLAKTRKG